MQVFRKIKQEIQAVSKMLSFIFKIGMKECIFAAIICIFTAFMYPLLLELNYTIVENIEKNSNYGLGHIIGLIVAVIFVSAIFQITNHSNLLLFEKMHIKVGTSLMRKIYTLASHIPHSDFDDPDKVADLNRIVLYSQDSMLTQNVVHVISMFCNMVSLILIFPVVYRAGAEVFFLILAAAFISNIFNFNEGVLRWKHRHQQEKNYIRRDKLKSVFFDKEAIMEMRMLSSKQFMQQRWFCNNEEIFKTDFEFDKKLESKKLLFNILRSLLKISPFIYITWKFGFGHLNIATVFLVWQVQEQFNRVMESVFFEFKAVHYSVPGIEELYGFFVSDDFCNHDESPKESAPIIALKNVSFGYTNDHYVLKNINLEIAPGEKVAIIGPNGAGKTTLVKLLTGLYEATEGKIERSFQRANEGSVWQDFVKFEFTLQESIGLGFVSQIQEESDILELCKKLEIDTNEFRLKDVLGRSFDPDGKIPSGGQWQKIAIARAVFGQKEVLYMDEPTASLDPLSEVNLYSEVKQIFNDKTVIFVSHRVGFANLADRIIVVDDNQIVEDGTHEQLMDKKGYYYHFYNEQVKWYIR